jgi:hypothetical protein
LRPIKSKVAQFSPDGSDITDSEFMAFLVRKMFQAGGIQANSRTIAPKKFGRMMLPKMGSKYDARNLKMPDAKNLKTGLENAVITRFSTKAKKSIKVCC